MKIAVLLAGCGLGDGSQIEEVIASYISFDKIGAIYVPVALNAEQQRTVNHRTEQTEISTRNILDESARIGRGRIISLSNTSSGEFGALIIPGGLGLLANYTNLFSQNDTVAINEAVKRFILGFIEESKPIGVMCSAIQLASLLFESEGKKATLYGTKEQLNTSERIHYQNVSATDIVDDSINNVISTPAFLESQNLYHVSIGIDKLVNKVYSRILGRIQSEACWNAND